MPKATSKGSTLPVSSAPNATGAESGPPSQAALIESFLTGAAEGEPGTEAGPPPPQGGDEPGNETESTPVLSQTEHEPPGEPPGGEPDAVEGEEPPAPKGKGKTVEFTPEQQEVFNHRLGKEVSKRKAAETEMETLRAELETARTGQPKPPGQQPAAPAAPDSDPVEQAPDVAKARTEANQHRQVANGAKALLKRVAHEPEAVAEELKGMGIKLSSNDPEAIAEWLDEAREGALTRANQAETRATVLAERQRVQVQVQMQQVDAQAMEVYPWHSDPESDQFQRAAAIVRQYPAILKRPDRLMVLGDLVEGQLAREARTKNGKPAAPKPKTAPPPRLPGPSSASPAAVRPASRVEFPKDTTNPESRTAFIGSMLD